MTTRRGISVSGQTWDAATNPWVRRQPTNTATRCPFCGADTAILSAHDDPDDPGRVELYCDNGNCDAREITILVMRDGTFDTGERTDVRALRAVDHGPEDEAVPTLGHLFGGTEPQAAIAAIAARRARRRETRC